MSVLETFMLLFETNTDEVKKGADEAGRVVDNLENKIKNTDTATSSLSGSFMGVAKTAAAMLATFVSIGAITRGVFATSEFTARMNDASESLGISVETLTTWGAAVKENGGSTEGFIGSVQSLSSAMAMMDATGRSRVFPFFKQLGIDMLDASGKARPVLDLLPELADAFQKMPKEQANAFGRRLGLDQGTILLLQQGRREVEAVLNKYKELGIVTQKDAAISDKFHDSLDMVGHVLTVLFAKIGSMILPVMGKLAESFASFVSWIADNQRLVLAFFTALASIMTVLLLPAIAALGSAIYTIGLPIAAAIGLITILADDFMAFFDGAPSLVGAVVDKLTDMWVTIKGIVNDIKLALQYTGMLAFGDVGMKHIQSLSYETPNFTPAQRSQFLNGAGVKTTNVNIGEVKVQTQATDADGISKAIGTSLDTQMRHTLSNMDDGVKR